MSKLATPFFCLMICIVVWLFYQYVELSKSTLESRHHWIMAFDTVLFEYCIFFS